MVRTEKTVHLNASAKITLNVCKKLDNAYVPKVESLFLCYLSSLGLVELFGEMVSA